MLCFKIKNTKDFMQKFLMTDAFSPFLLAEARIDTSVRFDIDGRVRKEFYTKEEQELQEFHEFAAWESIRPQVVQIVKGKRTPLFMKFVLVYDPKLAKVCLEENTDGGSMLKHLLCTVKYENGVITLTGGVSYQGFTMDKTSEKSWEHTLALLLDKIGLEYEVV